MQKIKVDKDYIEKRVRDILVEGVGISENDPSFKNTPKRVAKMFSDFFTGLDDDRPELENIIKRHFPVEYDGVVIRRGIKVFSLCPHHLLPSIFEVSLAFIPNKRTTGFSNITKLIENLGRKPVLQETFTQQIVDWMNKWLEPKGVICIVNGYHMCSEIYKVREGEATTQASSGLYVNNHDMVMQFLKLIKEEN